MQAHLPGAMQSHGMAPQEPDRDMPFENNSFRSHVMFPESQKSTGAMPGAMPEPCRSHARAMFDWIQFAPFARELSPFGVWLVSFCGPLGFHWPVVWPFAYIAVHKLLISIRLRCSANCVVAGTTLCQDPILVPY